MANPTANWWDGVSALLSHQLQTEESFRQAVTSVTEYVESKHAGRNTSNKLFQTEGREKMVQSLWNRYQEQISVGQLLQKKLMRHLVKHDATNEKNKEFIFREYVPQMMKKLPSEALEKECDKLAIQVWLTELMTTVADPTTLEKQKESIGQLPEEEKEKLMDGRRTLGTQLMATVRKGWLDSNGVLQVKKQLEDEKPLIPVEELNKETAIDYLVYKYKELVISGGQHAPTFRKSLVDGLDNYSRDPTVTKAKSS